MKFKADWKKKIEEAVKLLDSVRADITSDMDEENEESATYETLQDWEEKLQTAIETAEDVLA